MERYRGERELNSSMELGELGFGSGMSVEEKYIEATFTIALLAGTLREALQELHANPDHVTRAMRDRMVTLLDSDFVEDEAHDLGLNPDSRFRLGEAAFRRASVLIFGRRK